MEWFHCNDCFKRDHSKTLFLLLPCGRILCTDCHSRNPCTGKPCSKCRANGYTTTTLKNDLPAEIADFFRNPNVLLKKYIKVVDFQKRHRDSIFNHMVRESNRLSAEYDKVKDATFHLQQQHNSRPPEPLVHENQALKATIRKLEADLEQIKASQSLMLLGRSDQVLVEQWNRHRLDHQFDSQVPRAQTPVGQTTDKPAAPVRSSTPMYLAPNKRPHGNSDPAAANVVRTTPNYGPSGSKRSTPSHPPPAKRASAPMAPPISRLVQNTPAFFHSTPLPAGLPTPMVRSTFRPTTFQRPLPSVNARPPLASRGYLPPTVTPVAGYIPRTNQSAYSFERVFSFMSSASQQAKSNLDKKTLNRQ